MIHYHGTPIGGSGVDAARFLAGRHGLVPFFHQNHMGIVAEVCQSFVLDNSAYTIWRQGGTLDVAKYAAWVEEWMHHPGFDFAIMPDVIEGSEEDNRKMRAEYFTVSSAAFGASSPVWHMYESLEELRYLCGAHRVVSIGSSGEWPTPGTARWWTRMGEAMDCICDSDGRPPCKLHGLRMLSPEVFRHLPLSSADSVNAARNNGAKVKYGMFMPPTAAQRSTIIADRAESFNSAPCWRGIPKQEELFQ